MAITKSKTQCSDMLTNYIRCCVNPFLPSFLLLLIVIIVFLCSLVAMGASWWVQPAFFLCRPFCFLCGLRPCFFFFSLFCLCLLKRPICVCIEASEEFHWMYLCIVRRLPALNTLLSWLYAFRQRYSQTALGCTWTIGPSRACIYLQCLLSFPCNCLFATIIEFIMSQASLLFVTMTNMYVHSF